MKNKKSANLEDAVGRIGDGATLLIGGFAEPGVPEILIDGVCDLKRRDLTIITNNPGRRHSGIVRLIAEGRVRVDGDRAIIDDENIQVPGATINPLA